MDMANDGTFTAAKPAGITSSKLLIAVRFHKSEDLVAPFLESLIACVADLAGMKAEVVLYGDSPAGALHQAASANAESAIHLT